MTTGLIAHGAWLPRARLQRTEIANAHAWLAPGLKGLAKGERTTANWDEDAVTMAVEAVRDALEGHDPADVGGVWMASTSFPFLDRQNAGIVADALALPREIVTLDLASSQRSGTAALAVALRAAGGFDKPLVVVAADRSRDKAASTQEMTRGDGAAAFVVGQGEGVIARLIGQRSDAVDFVDHFRSEGAPFDYGWEERWVRDEGYLKIVPETLRALLAQTGADPAGIGHFVFPVAARRVAGQIAKAVGIPEAAVADNLQATVGETGCAHPLLMLAGVLERARPGEKILVAGFGQGCDALLFEVTEAIDRLPPRSGLSGALAARREERRYSRYLASNDLLKMEYGIRSEVDKQTGLSTLYRNKGMSQALIGGRCTACGTPQFPSTRVCVNPDCGAIDSQTPHRFAETPATINSFTADRLTYTPDPPQYFGMVQFAGGGRLMADFTDIDPDADLQVGQPMKMVFRVKDYDQKRGFRRYFWKATPVQGAQAQTEGN